MNMVEVEVTDQVRGLGLEESVGLVIQGQPVVICRTEAGLRAAADRCTHADARLSEGYVIDDSIECPLHQARYDLATGALIEGPSCPALTIHRLREADGRVWLEL